MVELIRYNGFKLSRSSLLVTTLILAFAWIARPLQQFLLFLVGSQGVSMFLWGLMAIMGIFVVLKIGKFSWTMLSILIFLAVLTAIYLTTLPIAEERLHILKYGALAILVCKDNKSFKVHHAIISGFLFSTATGIIDEGLQCLIPGRVGDLNDIKLNSIGAIWGSLCWAFLRDFDNRWKQKQ